MLLGCPNDAAELKSLSFVSDLFSFGEKPVKITYTDYLNMQPANQ